MSNAAVKYLLRESRRARNVRLRVTSDRGLEVIIPKGYDPGRVPRLLERKREWIRTALERAEANRQLLQPEPIWRPPTHIALPAISREWQVEPKETDALSVTIRADGANRLISSGRIHVEALCRAALARWMARQTREHVVPLLRELSLKMGLKYRNVCVRQQRTRWASCSRHSAVSLNVKLLFLPPDVLEYALIHELCHLVEMNHSKRFWSLVERYCPRYRSLDAQLREMWKSVPRWAAGLRALIP